jgi:hypothetical protein
MLKKYIINIIAVIYWFIWTANQFLVGGNGSTTWYSAQYNTSGSSKTQCTNPQKQYGMHYWQLIPCKKKEIVKLYI